MHKFIGDEPSGLIFNAPVLDNKNRPHNPCINSGAIMVCALLIKHNKKLEDILEFYKRASSSETIEVDFDQAYEEKITAYSNLALMYLMLSKKSFPQYDTPYESLKKA